MSMHTILVVDDDPAPREVITMVLEDSGHLVLTAKDGYEAVATLADRHVDLMITDVRMPGISGIELARQAKLFRPYLRIIGLSGYVEHASPELDRMLQKPVRADALLATIEQVLAGR